jgi:excinuclease ABC subunit C
MVEETKKNLSEKLANIPSEPGVYLYRDVNGKIIYAGKAKSLRHRVRSYFQESRQTDFKPDYLRAEIAMSTLSSSITEMEALAF